MRFRFLGFIIRFYSLGYSILFFVSCVLCVEDGKRKVGRVRGEGKEGKGREGEGKVSRLCLLTFPYWNCRLCCGLIVDLLYEKVANSLRSCYGETVVMDFDL